MADPDKGLDTVCADLIKKNPSKNSRYETVCKVRVTMNWTDTHGIGSDNVKSYTMDEAKKVFSPSQKKALILQTYCEARMSYSETAGSRYNYWDAYKAEHFGNKKAPDDKFFKQVYNGTFKGVCSDGSTMATDLANAVGLTAINVLDSVDNHSWCAVKVTDKSGSSYYQGVAATADAFNVKLSTPGDKDINGDKYLYHLITTKIYTIEQRKQPVRPSAAPAPTKALAVTQAPAAQPAKTPAPTPAATPFNPDDIPPTRTLPPELLGTPEPVETQAPTAEPTVAPTPAPVVTPEPEPTVAPTPAPTVEPAPEQRIMIPASEHGYACAGCDRRHPNKSNPYISNKTTTYKTGFVVYAHVLDGNTRYFDSDGNEYIDINGDGTILDELETLFG